MSLARAMRSSVWLWSSLTRTVPSVISATATGAPAGVLPVLPSPSPDQRNGRAGRPALRIDGDRHDAVPLRTIAMIGQDKPAAELGQRVAAVEEHSQGRRVWPATAESAGGWWRNCAAGIRGWADCRRSNKASHNPRLVR